MGAAIKLTATTSGSSLGYAWSFGDGSTDTTSGATPSHIYANSGSYQVSVTVTDTSTGLKATAMTTVVVLMPSLSASITTALPSSPQTGQAVTFTGSGTGQGTVTYTWDFGDGSPTSPAIAPTHVYSTAGSYTVTLNITDSGLHVGIATTTVNVTAAASTTAATAQFTYQGPVVIDKTTNFNASGTGQGNLNYAWNFGDNSTGTGASTSHTFTKTGSYIVSLTMTDSTGASATTTQTLSVVPPPAPSISAISATPLKPMANQGVSFQGIAYSGYTLNYSWNFGDGSTSTAGSSVVHTFSNPGTYSVSLTVTDINGAQASATATIVVTRQITTSLLAGISSQAGSSDGTGTSAQFNNPGSMAADASGNLYIADTGNSIIRKITPAGVVTTLAGTAHANTYFSCLQVDGSGAAATFCALNGITVDSASNIYVTDGSALRKITPAGAVSTLAGAQNAVGYKDGTGSQAEFNAAAGLAVDSSGNIYVADGIGIRKVTPAGVVTTLTGNGYGGCSLEMDGSGSAATFCGATGLTIDSSGNLYVTDTNGNTVRKVTPAGVVTTLAGYPGSVSPYGGCQSIDGVGVAASFCAPHGIAIDGNGNLYVADTRNNTIRLITPAAKVTTLAGSAGHNGNVDGTGSAAQFNAPTGIAFANNAVYVADSSNNTIRQLTLGGVVTTFAGTQSAIVIGSADGQGAAARFDGIAGMAADSNGNIYVADSQNNTIRKITPTGLVSTLAGTAHTGGACTMTNGTGPAASFCALQGLSMDAAGNIYVVDSNAVRVITPAGAVSTLAGSTNCGFTNGTGSAASFCSPRGLAVDGAGNVYVADASNYAIRKIAPGGVVTTLAGGTSGTWSSPFYYFYYPYASCVAADGTGTAATFCTVQDLAVDGSGNIYATDFNSNTIREITPAGVVTTLAGQNGAAGAADGAGTFAQFSNPTGIAFDSNGYLDVVDSNGLRQVTLTGAVSTINGLSTPNMTYYYNYYYSNSYSWGGNYPTYVALLPNHQLAFTGSGATAVLVTVGL